MHSSMYERAGETVKVTFDTGHGEGTQTHDFRIEDYWDRVSGKSWTLSDGNPAAMKYAMRSGIEGLPMDDEVLYGKVGSFGHLIHVSEIK